MPQLNRSPVTSPAVTRSQMLPGGGRDKERDKDKDKKALHRTLSDPGDVSPQLTAAIQAAINNAVYSEQLSAHIAAKVSETVLANLTDALQTANNRITELTSEVDRLRTQVQQQAASQQRGLDDLAQYQRRNSLRVFGIPESPREDTDSLVLGVFSERMGVDVEIQHICRSHRVGRTPQPGNKGVVRPRPILVKFTTYRQRSAVYASKKKLKGTSVTIKEDLTKTRLAVYKKAAEKYGARRVWTLDGRIHWLDEHGNKGVATCEADLIG